MGAVRALARKQEHLSSNLSRKSQAQPCPWKPGVQRWRLADPQEHHHELLATLQPTSVSFISSIPRLYTLFQGHGYESSPLCESQLSILTLKQEAHPDILCVPTHLGTIMHCLFFNRIYIENYFDLAKCSSSPSWTLFSLSLQTWSQRVQPNTYPTLR